MRLRPPIALQGVPKVGAMCYRYHCHLYDLGEPLEWLHKSYPTYHHYISCDDQYQLGERKNISQQVVNEILVTFSTLTLP